MDTMLIKMDVDTAGRGGDTMKVIIVGRVADIIVKDWDTQGF